jgi:hypothetical protein
MNEARFETYRSSPDFLQLHVFPGGMLSVYFDGAGGRQAMAGTEALWSL